MMKVREDARPCNKMSSLYDSFVTAYLAGEAPVEVDIVVVSSADRLEAVRVHAWHEVDLRVVQELGHPGIQTIVGDEVLGQGQDHLPAHALVPVHVACTSESVLVMINGKLYQALRIY